jgi:NAD(P)-dependent dehydrogenase (short-subunit alcohol dehydrogenase family)
MHLLTASPTHGRIINISSIGSTMSDPATHQPAYQASKAALNHLTRLLASKLRETGIRVNAISPGYFPSQMNDPTNPKSMLARAKELVPLKRGGEEEDAAGTAIWLASRAGSYVHGEVIPLAGGRNWA